MIPIPAKERAEIALALGLHEQYLYQGLNSKPRPLPARHVVGIERATAGRRTCETLRPDVRWVRVPDPTWPHPEGRPCIDVAAPVAQEAA